MILLKILPRRGVFTAQKARKARRKAQKIDDTRGWYRVRSLVLRTGKDESGVAKETDTKRLSDAFPPWGFQFSALILSAKDRKVNGGNAKIRRIFQGFSTISNKFHITPRTVTKIPLRRKTVRSCGGNQRLLQREKPHAAPVSAGNSAQRENFFILIWYFRRNYSTITRTAPPSPCFSEKSMEPKRKIDD